MNKRIDIVEGKITKNLFRLSLPIILTSLISILYNLTDIKFISTFLGDDAVSSAAAATFFVIFSGAFLIVPKNGAQILVAQSIGAKIYKNARSYARISIILTFITSIFCLLVAVLFSDELIKIVGVKEADILRMSAIFLKISALGFPFLFMTFTLSAIISADGNTFVPFICTSTGIISNVILDYVFLGVLNFGISGAAYATIISQIISCIMLIVYIKTSKSKFRKMKILKLDTLERYINLIRIGFPAGLSQALFTIISIIIATQISKIDVNALGVQRLGVQFEALSWNISIGVSSAVSTYVAQNYGAKKYDRVDETYRIAIKTMSIFGFFITAVFIIFARPLFSTFFEEVKYINYGVSYLRIIGLAQVFQCIEIITSGAYNGMGRVTESTIISVVGTALRIPFVFIFAPIFGLNSIWIIISLSMFLKGIVSYVWYKISWRKFIEKNK